MNTHTTIEQCILQGDEYYHLAEKINIDTEDRSDYRYLAGCHYRSAMLLPGTEHEQLVKIDIALILMELLFRENKELNKTIIEGYFYTAVHIARTYLGEEWFSETRRGEQLIRAYLRYIDPVFQSQFCDRRISSFIPLLILTIVTKSNKYRQREQENIVKILQTGGENESASDIIDILERYCGPVRIYIVSGEGSEVIARHNIGEDYTLCIRPRILPVSIHDKKKEYRYTIDRGSDEELNQFTEEEHKTIIEPLLSIYIQKREYAFFIWMMDNMSLIESYESENKENTTPKDYHRFIQRVLDISTISEEDTGIYIAAIDICRQITLHPGSREECLMYMDTVLDGRVNRRILGLVEMILLSRHETMNGGGYPYGLYKRSIPTIGRISAIIRAYEALLQNYNNDTHTVLSKMQEWCQGGYFDSSIFRIFRETLSEKDGPKDETIARKFITPSEHRISIYERYLEQWSQTQSIISGICDGYMETRLSAGDQVALNILYLKIGKLTLSLRQISTVRKIIIVTRHGETISDRGSDIPGSEDETITEEGIESSHAKGKILQGLNLEVYTSPVRRSRETADIVSQSIGKYQKILIEDALKNPKKSLNNGRYDSYPQKLLADNTKDIMNFLIELISSPIESSTLIIAHRDSIRHIIFWLTNLFIQDRVHGSKSPVDNNSLYTFYFRGDHIIMGADSMCHGLIFSVENWRTLGGLLTSMSEDFFGIGFCYDMSMPIDIIGLHDRFLDYIDEVIDRYPSRIGEFLDRLDRHPETQHIRGILEGEGYFYHTKIPK